MKSKLILVFILLFSTNAYSMSPGDWYDNVRRVQTEKYQKAAKESVETSCDRKLREYVVLSAKYPSSRYYKWKVKSWTYRCNKERLRK